MKQIDDFGYCVVDQPYSSVKSHLLRQYPHYVICGIIRLKIDYFNGKRMKKTERNFLFVYDVLDKNRVSVLRNNAKQCNSLQNRIIKITRKKNVLGKRVRKTTKKLKNTQRTSKRRKQTLKHYKQIIAAFKKRKRCSQEFITLLVNVIKKKECIRDVVRSFSKEFKLNISDFGTASTSVRRKYKDETQKNRVDLEELIRNLWVQYCHDSGNKKGNLYDSNFRLVCYGKNEKYCIPTFKRFVNKLFSLPLRPPNGKGGAAIFTEFQGNNRGLNCSIYSAVADDGPENTVFNDSLQNTQNYHQLWTIIGIVHRYNTFARHTIRFSFRNRLLSGKKTRAFSNLFSEFEMGLFKCFDYINSNHENLKEIDKTISCCCYTQTRIGKCFPAARKLVIFIEKYNVNVRIRDYVFGNDPQQHFFRSMRNNEFRMEMCVLISLGSIIMENIYFITQSYGGVVAPILRIKLCQCLVFINMIRYYVHDLFDYFFASVEGYYTLEYDISLYNLYLSFASYMEKYIYEYFRPWLLDLNYQLALIWHFNYATMIDNYVENKKSNNPTSVEPFFGFYYDDDISKAFQTHINNEPPIQLHRYPDDHVLLSWYCDLFALPMNQIKSEQKLGHVLRQRITTPSATLNTINDVLFNRYTTLKKTDKRIILENRNLKYANLDNEEREYKQWFHDLWTNRGALLEFDEPQLDDNFKNSLFFFKITESEQELKLEINRKVSHLLRNGVENKPPLRKWIRLLRKNKFHSTMSEFTNTEN